MITQPKVSSDADTGVGIEADNGVGVEYPEQQKIELAVTSRLRECGCEIPPETVHAEVRRALERFRDVRVRQYVSIFAARDACAAVLDGPDGSGAAV